MKLILKPILESSNLPEEEIKQLQDITYSKKTFNLNFPLLVKQNSEYDRLRYYKEPVTINGTAYMICSQWVERPDKNDRPFLIKWITEHQKKS